MVQHVWWDVPDSTHVLLTEAETDVSWFSGWMGSRMKVCLLAKLFSLVANEALEWAALRGWIS